MTGPNGLSEFPNIIDRRRLFLLFCLMRLTAEHGNNDCDHNSNDTKPPGSVSSFTAPCYWQRTAGHPGNPSLSWPSLDPEHGSLHGVGTRSVQEFLEGLTLRLSTGPVELLAAAFAIAVVLWVVLYAGYW